MKPLSLLLAAAAALSLAACPGFVKATGPVYAFSPAAEGKAVVYFFRPAKKIMSAYPFFMSIPESANNCFRLESGGYTRHEVAPGTLRVAGMANVYTTKTLELSAGDVRFVQVVVDDDATDLAEVPREDAEARIAKTRGIDTCGETVQPKG